MIHDSTVDNSNYLKLQPSNSFAVKEFESATMFAAMNSRETGGRFTPTAIRLRAIRRASHAPARKDFADFLGFTLSQLSNFENGYPISRIAQNKIVEKLPWVSRGYLMDGDQGSLTVATLQRLLPLVEEESNTTLPRSRSRASSGR